MLQPVRPHHDPQEVGDVSSFSQWFVSYQKNPGVKQATWVCGTEPVLIEDVVDTVRSHFPENEWSQVSLVAGETKDRLIWEEIDQYPLDGEAPRLVIVRDAERLKRPEAIIDWLAVRTRNPLTYVLFVSNEPELARLEQTPEQRKDRKKADLQPHIQALQKRGSVIECRAFTQATAKHAVSWVVSKVEMPRGVAGKLLERANADLRLVRDSLAKLAVFPDEISMQTIESLMSARPRLSFVDALLELDKPEALRALDAMSPSQYSQALGLLDQRLELLGTVRDMLVSHSSVRQISAALGAQGFLAAELIPRAKSYDRARLRHIRDLLAATDAALMAGVRRGPMEALVLYW